MTDPVLAAAPPPASIDLVFNGIGLAGFALIMLAYVLLQVGRLPSTAPAYSLINLVGSSAIVVSLLHDWNLPSFVLEFTWAVVSIYGLARTMNAKRRAGAS